MFLHKLLPSDGYYCVAMLLKNGGFRHHWHDTLAEAQKHIEVLSATGNNVYIAQATYDKEKVDFAEAARKTLAFDDPERKKHKTRGQLNAVSLKNFFLDIDCGEKWELKTQAEGVAALKQFITDTGLPFPAVVSSGNGLYAHWILNTSVPAQQWRTVAFLLKNVVAAYSQPMAGDSTRTSDTASVLRPPGTTNRKNGFPVKNVSLLKDADPIEFAEFAKLLGKAAKKRNINTTALTTPKTSDVNADMMAGLDSNDGPPSIADKVASHCAQIRVMKDTKGDLSEPLWYACLGVVVHCEDGKAIAHDWSSGHPQYSVGQTDSKISQWLDGDIGPSTCANFGMIEPTNCIGCPHINKIKSPIVLGRPDPEEKALAETECGTPPGFRRSEEGLFADVDGRWVPFYDRDLYIRQVAYDESLGYEVMTIKHSLPYEGDMECTLRSNIVNDSKTLMMALSDNHIKVVGQKEKKLMTQYMESYQQKLLRERRMGKLLCQMGWKETSTGDPMFVLGKKIFHVDGSKENSEFAKNVPQAARGFHSKGLLKPWADATTIFDRPGMEPLALALLIGGFGAPLIKFTGFDGAVVSMFGNSGAGKTLMLRMINSIWGKHSDLMLLRDDTRNAMMKRMGTYGNLSATLDEVTNMEGMELSDTVYRFTQGRDKMRLTKSAVESTDINKWNTVATTSSNSSLVEKLSGVKQDASAEINRILEIPINRIGGFDEHSATDLYWTITNNYGLAGEKYIQYLVTHIKEVERAVLKAKELVESRAKISGEERFWGALMGIGYAGGVIARSLGIANFDIERVISYGCRLVHDMRDDKKTLTGDAVGMLAKFLDSHAANRLLVKGNFNLGPQHCTIIESPRGKLSVRYEVDTQRVYISRDDLRMHIAKNYGSYSQCIKDLKEKKVLLNANKRRTLGAGTFYASGQQPCWEIDMTSPALGSYGAECVDSTTRLATTELETNINLRDIDL